MKHSKCKDINRLVKSLIGCGAGIDRGKKHRKLRLKNGRFVVIPSIPSDWRVFQNFKHDVKRESVTVAEI